MVQATLPSVEKSNAMRDLIKALTDAKKAYGSPKNFARMAIEDPAGATEAAQAAKGMTEGLRIIQTLA